ncbi:uncharacterized protein [Lolium perenne]|uniref:uncharacterized protein n=1 Tax=Lolium perenne TaxID=4522 RepID=UPI0021F518E5|nr:E3 ubiquitin-protein ligase makorin-like isoform X2 [Lolium perenne]
MSTARVLCSFSKHGACVEGESSELSHHSTGQANNVCAFYQKGACSNDARFTHDHVGVSHSNPVFQHGGATTGETPWADGPAPSAQVSPPSAPSLPTVTVGVPASAQMASGFARAPSA